MGDDLGDLVRDMAMAATAPNSLSIPDSVGDPEAVHEVQKRYADAGFECDEDTATSIVDDARARPRGVGGLSHRTDDRRFTGWVRRVLARGLSRR